MATIPRLSTNTSLKNARIFDDDAWDENDRPKVQIKSEPDECSTNDELKVEPLDENIPDIRKSDIKCEPIDDMKEDFENKFSESGSDDYSIEERDYKSHLKAMVTNETSTPKSFSCNEINGKARVKREYCINDTLEEGELKDSFFDSSILNKSKQEPVETRHGNMPSDGSLEIKFNDSPYGKEMFNGLRIKEETPVKEDASGTSKNPLKMGVKRTIFSRHSPYKKDDCDTFKKRVTIKNRLDTGLQKRSEPKPQETDPVVIARREKQIEYGKNTVGYENYIKTVPIHERKPEDPKTPPRYKQYSRRAWEGLIRQWRIRLHKYDPSGSSDFQ